MAHAEELSEQVKYLNSRVQELEQILQTQAQLSNMDTTKQEQIEPQSHPLKPGSPAELDNHHEAQPNSPPETIEESLGYGTDVKLVTDRIGSLAIGQEGQMRYRGETAGAEVCEQYIFVIYDSQKLSLAVPRRFTSCMFPNIILTSFSDMFTSQFMTKTNIA